MKTGNPTGNAEDTNCPPRRRSARLSPPGENLAKSAPLGVAKRSIIVRKIAPRKTNVVPEDNKENKHRQSGGSQQKNPKKSAPGPTEALPPKTTILSPILAPSSPCPQAPEEPQNLVWSKKVRRSYSRLSQSDQSFESSSPSSGRRRSLFGFEKLQTPEVIRKVERSKVGAEVSRSLCSLLQASSSSTLLDGDDSALAPLEPDVNIPGVALVKEKKRRKRVPQLKLTEVDSLAAQMNAEFEEAEGFELVVE
ncbi:sororin isoform X2 [Osmerus eperlanus]|uniref:sororin isoform X2 n=1 Tax=Osmerus eperlanus TaxID=29151 RepID=UPI002E14F403